MKEREKGKQIKTFEHISNICKGGIDKPQIATEIYL